MKLGKNLILVLKAIGMTMFAFILSWLLVAPFSSSTSSIFSSPEKTDFVLSDFYAQVADQRPVRKLSDRILLIDIDRAGREEIAEFLDLAVMCEPEIVGVDIYFEESRANDSILLHALSMYPKIVMPVGLRSEEKGEKFEIEDKPFFYGSLDNVIYGAVNLPGKYEKSTIREFRPFYPLAEGGAQPSFVSAIVKEVDNDAYSKLRERNKEFETIDYPSHELPFMTIPEAFENPERLTGKIVLIGALNEAGDMHATPVRSSMSGLSIHAHALHTALEGRYYTSIPSWLDHFIAAILCFILVILNIGVKSKIRGLILRVLQVSALYVAVRVGYALYVDHRMIFNFATTFLMITFGFFATDIWNGVEAILQWIRKGVKWLMEKMKHRRETI